MKLHSLSEYAAWAHDHAYHVTAVAFAVTSVAMFATGHAFVGVLGIAGMGLSGSVIIADGLPNNKGDDDDQDYNSYQ